MALSIVRFEDSNSVLTQLEKRSRASNIGVQCEAIVRLPLLFEKYPFPIFIDSSFLKLADIFVSGSNRLRYWILRVCQQSEKYLDKILNIDAFLLKIVKVMRTKDPVARALTLRTFGAMSGVISNKRKVHRAVKKALSSQNGIELVAAIIASGQLAARIKSFAITICPKISDMIESLSTPLAMKLLLIPLLRHMHHDSDTAAMAKDVCLNLLPKYPEESFVILVIDNLTQLTAKTLFGITEHIELLMDFLNDTRHSVRCQTLKSLKLLIQEESLHAWSKTLIIKIIEKAQSCEDPIEEYHFLNLIQKLTLSPLACHIFLTEQRKQISDFCSNFFTNNYKQEQPTAALAVLTDLFTYSGINRLNVCEFEHFDCDTDNLLLSFAHYENDFFAYKALDCCIKISMMHNFFLKKTASVIELIIVEEPNINLRIATLFCETLGKLGEYFEMQKYEKKLKQLKGESPTQLEELMGTVEEYFSATQLNPLAEICLSKILAYMLDFENIQERLKLVEMLTALKMQSIIGYLLPAKDIETFDKYSKIANCWTMYRLARSCSRYGQHYLASKIYSKIAQAVHPDRMHFYFLGMSQISKAECAMIFGVDYEVMEHNYAAFEEFLKAPESHADTFDSMELLDRLEEAKNQYWQAITNFKACSSTTHRMTFQLEYIKLRFFFLQTLQSAVKVARLILSPSFIGSSLVQIWRDHLRPQVEAIKGCQVEYSRLYRSDFDADPFTLELIEIMEYQCALLAHAMERICYTIPPDLPSYLPKGSCVENIIQVICCHRMEALLDRLPDEAEAFNVMAIFIGMVEEAVTTQQCLPRYFFQKLQSTHIKLSISPQPRVPGEPVIVQSESSSVVKVDGVIQQFGRQQDRFRDIDTVQLTFSSQLVMSRSGSDMQSLSSLESVKLSQTVKPDHTSFSCSFLLPTSTDGKWKVVLEAFIIDTSGFIWSTGSKQTMIVRIFCGTIISVTVLPEQ